MGKEKKELAKTEGGALAPRPDYIGEGNEGMEQMRPQDLVLPRIKLLQALSPEVAEGDMKAGTMVNTLTGEVVVEKDETIEFVPVQHYLEWIEWAPRSSNQGIIDRSRDAQSELAMRSAAGESVEVDGRKKFVVTEYHNFVVAVPSLGLDVAGLIVLSCNRSSHKRGKQLLSLARFRGKCPLFAGRYKLSSTQETNKNNESYYNYVIKNAGWATEEEFAALKQVHESLQQVTVSTEQEDEPDAAGPSGDKPSGDGDF